MDTQKNKYKEMNQQKRKVIHVHFHNGHKNHYFGSVTAVYRKFKHEQLGITEIALRHHLTSDGSLYVNAKCMVIRSRLE